MRYYYLFIFKSFQCEIKLMPRTLRTYFDRTIIMHEKRANKWNKFPLNVKCQEEKNQIKKIKKSIIKNKQKHITSA